MNKYEFIEKAKAIHGDKYDYSKVEYKNTGDKVIIRCPIHGDFEKTPMNHLKGQGCPKCSKEQKHSTTEEFIKKARKIHGDKYDYSKVVYVNNKTKVCIICPEHGEFWQVPSSHLNGNRCPKCAKKGSGERGKLILEEFIKKAIKVHGDKYDYSKVEYVNNHTKVCIICPIHGEFWQMPQNHIKGQGCPKCSHRSYVYTTEEFIQKAKKIHKDKYDYSKLKYVNSKTFICIICPIHGEFWQMPFKHIRGQGCPKCNKSYKMAQNIFIQKANEVHNKKYNYSKVNYINTETKVCIICPEHGEFWQTPHSHLNGVGCPECAREHNISENKLYEYLKNNYSFDIEKQKKFKWLNGKSLDIFIPQYNIAVEYQGRQHFIPIDYFGGEKSFKSQYKRDIDKYNECKEHNIHLLYFSNENEIPNDYMDSIYTKEEDLLNRINQIINNS